MDLSSVFPGFGSSLLLSPSSTHTGLACLSLGRVIPQLQPCLFQVEVPLDYLSALPADAALMGYSLVFVLLIVLCFLYDPSSLRYALVCYSQSIGLAIGLLVYLPSIDVKDVGYVIVCALSSILSPVLTIISQNYDFPNNCEDYIHRIGRTGVSTRFIFSATQF